METESCPGTGTFSLSPEGGNYVPADVDGTGTFSIDDEALVLADLWLGTPSGDEPTEACGHRFE